MAKILFTGLTGVVGQAITAQLGNYAIEAKALVRDNDKADALQSAGVETIQGDIADVDALRRAFQNVDKVFLLLSNSPDQLRLEKQFADIARECGIPHVVKMSAIGANTESPVEVKRCHGLVEQHLEASGMAYTFIQPNFFMQNFLHVAAQICQQDCFAMPMADARVGSIDVRDVATAVLEVLSGDGHENAAYEISGPQLHSFEDAASQLSDIQNRPIAYAAISNDEFQGFMKQAGTDPWYVDAIAELFASIADGSNARITQTYKKITACEPRSLSSFLTDHAGAFVSSK